MAGNKQRRANNASAKNKKAARGPMAKQRPNDECRCGSGKKFKHCCWRNAVANGGTGMMAGGVRHDSLREATLRRRAEAGDADASCKLGWALYMRGEEAEAAKWVRWAAEEKGNATAMGLLGWWYMDGKGVPQDTLEGQKWVRRHYETCIERGDDVETNKAMLAVTNAKINRLTGGEGLIIDDASRCEALRRRAEAYEANGRSSIEALRRPAEAGDARAGWMLGEALMNSGEEAEAVKWMRWAAEKGWAGAMVALGRWYKQGKGVPQDELEGCKWMRRNYETTIELGVDVEASKARVAAVDARICQLSGGPDMSSASRAAVKQLKAALEEDPENEGLAGMLEDLKLDRVCDGCGASARDEGVRLRVCTRCRQAFFCSQACLERSFERHKPDCTRLRAQRKARERAKADQE